MIFNQNLAKITINKLIQEAKRLKALEISIDFKLGKAMIKNQLGDIVSSITIPAILVDSLKKELKSNPNYLSSYEMLFSKNKIKIILSPETKISLSALSKNNNLSDLYDILIKKSGIIVISSAQYNLKNNLAKAVLEAFDEASYHIVSITDAIDQKAKHGLIAALKNLDADIIHFETASLSDEVLPLLDLADKKLIIISVLAKNTWDALRPLTKTLPGKNFLNKINLAIYAKKISLICADCQASYPLNNLLREETGAKLGVDKDILATQTFYYGSGCPKCNYTGEKNSLILIESANLANINYQNEKDWRQYFDNPPHNTWIEQAFELVLTGKISLEKLLLEL